MSNVVELKSQEERLIEDLFKTINKYVTSEEGISIFVLIGVLGLVQNEFISVLHDDDDDEGFE